ncbi:corrinoid protein [Crassaminicella profunda]|uniref:corrinoid protein n=1 Tax=Crassaminicella profunda TaxID=1286698 RepID=UPI001CA7B559|nr:corrinoid protein [Crassaminicella profunda]QZY54206.1 corrinoid protein [Crassaminicella profunda]
MMILKQIAEYLEDGMAPKVKELVQQALDEGLDPKIILEEGLLKGMEVIGKLFKENEIFVPEVMIAARAMNAGMSILEPVLVKIGNVSLGKVVIGTVKGDLHDIGKNIVGMMLKGAGLEVIDLGVDVSVEKFVDEAEAVGANIICMSALLTTTMLNMEALIKELENRGIRDQYIVMIGGAPVTDDFAKKIGANIYTPDAATAAEAAKEVLIA